MAHLKKRNGHLLRTGTPGSGHLVKACAPEVPCVFVCPPTYTNLTFTVYEDFAILGFSCSAWTGTYGSIITQLGAACFGGVNINCGDPSSSVLNLSLNVNTGVLTVGLIQFGQGQGSYTLSSCPPNTLYQFDENDNLVLSMAFT